MTSQYYLNGYKAGDPDDSRQPTTDELTPPLIDLPKEVDVLIVGCGPAGLMLAAQLSAFKDIRTCIVDQKTGPLQVGQADGVSGRSIEIFQAFNFAERVIKESYFLKAISFWRFDERNPSHIYRASLKEDGRSVYSEFPHVILNQARVHSFLLDKMRQSAAQITPHYCRGLLDLEVVSSGLSQSHVKVRLQRTDDVKQDKQYKQYKQETIKAKYVVGCDGARSKVRQLLDIPMQGDSANKAWGVMDLQLVTDFPDIRIKSVIQSREGNVMIIPREGGYLVRFYIEMDKLKLSQRVADLEITCEQLIEVAQRIFKPFTLDVKNVVWWSVYEIGQRIAEHFDNSKNTNVPANIFIAGDACHTHSPKAGQGMNVSMHDSFNLGWKLASVIQGRSSAAILKTYASERRAIAQQLIDFDRELSQAFSTQQSSPKQSKASATKLEKNVIKLEGFMSGTMTQYDSSLLTAEPNYQQLATGFPLGKRFHSAPVIRAIDARPMQLGHINKADGRWRIFAFARSIKDLSKDLSDSNCLSQLADFLDHSSHSPIRHYTPKGKDIDSVIDWAIVLNMDFFDLDLAKMPKFFMPIKGDLGLMDLEKIFCVDKENNIFSLRGIDSSGCLIVIRPDQHIANILPLNQQGFAAMATFFDHFMCRPESSM